MRKRKTGGRKKGVPNRATAEVKEKIDNLLSRYNPDQMFADFMELKPGERLKLFASLAEYLAPKQNRVTLENEGNKQPNVVLYLHENGRD